MLADSIADEPARAERGQETAGSSRSTMILIPVPMVRLAHHERNIPFNRVAEPVQSEVEGFTALMPLKIGKIDSTLYLFVNTNLSGRFDLELLSPFGEYPLRVVSSMKPGERALGAVV